jgi:deoxyribose-phosphate aldolase
MRRGAPGLLIKAAGRIRTLRDLKSAVKAGADIIGASSGAKIMEEVIKKYKK